MRAKWLILGIFLILPVIVSGCSKAPAAPIEKPTLKTSAAERDSHQLVIAGSGTNLTLTRKLADAYKAKFKLDVKVPNSIGSDGAVKAVKAGVLDMGLISRELSPAEKAAGLKSIPYAVIGLAFGTHADTPDDDVSIADIIKIHEGQKRNWSDGRSISVFIRNKEDSTSQTLFKAIPGFEALIDKALEAKRWQVMLRDPDMADVIRNHKGSFGPVDLADVQINGGIKVLTVGGVTPTPENVQSGRYPFSKPLSFVYKAPLSDRAKAFAEFAASAEGRDIIVRCGGIPVTP